jgi:uncharacterized cupredoxin-like copper-binding protein
VSLLLATRLTTSLMPVISSKAPYFTALELMVNGQLDLYFVPVTKGEYPVYCTIDDHRAEGMEGRLIIQ